MSIFIHDTAQVSPLSQIGENTKIWNHAQVREYVKVGRDCIISKNVYVDTKAVIGDRVKIQNNVNIYHGVTIENDVFLGPSMTFTNDLYPRAISEDWQIHQTLVKEGASVGAGAVIVCGTTIGRYALVGAGSVVTRDVPDHALVVGNPAVITGFVCDCGQKLNAAGLCGHCGKQFELEKSKKENVYQIKKEDIGTLYEQSREAVNDQWNRTMPLGELFVDRWEKARFLGFGENSSVYDSCIVMGEVTVGSNTWVGPNTLLDGTGGGLSIGNGCNVSMGVQIYTHDTVKRCLTGGKHKTETGRVVIGDCCYLAPQVIVTKGVTLGDCCVVAAQSLVKDSFESHSIIAGTPAKRIGRVSISGDDIRLVYDKEERKEDTNE